VSFISLQSTAGQPIALLANYSLHYVGGVPGTDISADYFAVFADRIQQLLGADRLDPPFVGIMTNGTSGDVNNINFRVKSERLPSYAKMRLVAHDVADAVLAAHQKLEYRNWVELKAAQTELTLAVRRPTRELLERAQRVLERPKTEPSIHRHEVEYARRTLNMAQWPEQIDIVLQAFRVGDLGITAIPFETFAETGLEIKQRSPLQPAFTIELANGGYGYLPTPRQHDLGGYETWLGTNRVQKDASVKIVARLMELLESLK
jgi:hypothetical protein